MTETTDVVVIGGGVNGASIAYHLAQKGVNVTLCERGRIGDGISGTSGAIVRQHHSVPQLAASARYSLEVYRDFENRIGGPSGFVETGYLVIVGRDERPTLEANLAALQAAGIDARLFEPGDLGALLPYANLDGVAGASWEPAAGYADGRLTAETFARRAADLGATIHLHRPVTGIRRGGGGAIAGVTTAAGPIDSAVVVVAASTGSPALMAPLGYAFPIAFEREWISFFRRPWELRAPHPAGVDLALRGHFRPEGDRASLFGGESSPEAIRVDDPAHYERRMSDAEIGTARAALSRRFPGMATAVALGGYGCVDDITPDWMPYLGTIDGTPGLIAAYGMSSHFFKHAPSVGRSLAELIVDGRSTVMDLPFFRPERIAEGAFIRSPHPYGDLVTL